MLSVCSFVSPSRLIVQGNERYPVFEIMLLLVVTIVCLDSTTLSILHAMTCVGKNGIQDARIISYSNDYWIGGMRV
jgi:hypothetical protein